MTEAKVNSSMSWGAKLLIAAGILVVAMPILYIAAVMFGLRAHLKDDCRELHLRQIGVRCRMHAIDHGGRFPAKWSELEWDDAGGITNTTWGKLFVCPTVGHDPGDWASVDQWCDYRLIPGRTTNDLPQTVLAIEPLSNHKTGANVLFVDGSSQWWPANRVLGEKTLSSSARE
jgi:prepilin-type processing-associated H-X9-DG protein